MLDADLFPLRTHAYQTGGRTDGRGSSPAGEKINTGRLQRLPELCSAKSCAWKITTSTRAGGKSLYSPDTTAWRKMLVGVHLANQLTTRGFNTERIGWLHDKRGGRFGDTIQKVRTPYSMLRLLKGIELATHPGRT